MQLSYYGLLSYDFNRNSGVYRWIQEQMISQSVECITTVQSMLLGNHTHTHTKTQLSFKSGDLESYWDEYYSMKN